MSGNLEWHGAEVMARLAGATEAGLARAAIHLQSSMKTKISKSGRRGIKSALAETGARSSSIRFGTHRGDSRTHGSLNIRTSSGARSLPIMTVRRSKSGKVKAATVHVGSSPGEPPRRQFGNLLANVVLNRMSATEYRVGVPQNAIYGFYLEVGTRRIKPRPWILATYNEQAQTLALLMKSAGF